MARCRKTAASMYWLSLLFTRPTSIHSPESSSLIRTPTWILGSLLNSEYLSHCCFGLSFASLLAFFFFFLSLPAFLPIPPPPPKPPPYRLVVDVDVEILE